MRDYGKVHTSFWSSPTITSMSEDARMLAMYLITSPHSTIAGVFRLPDGYVCEDLKWSAERVAKGFVELFGKGYANRCETTKWVWVRKHLEWNKPENPNQCKSAAKIAMSVPDECAWKLDFMRVSGPLLGIEWTPPTKPSETVAEPFLNQEQEQEQKQEQEQELDATASSSAKPTLPHCPYESLVGLYHEILPEMPHVRVMDDGRKKAIKSRWDWVLTSCKPDKSRRAETSAEGVEWFRNYFDRARDNDFLMGRTPRGDKHAGWKCDIEFLMSSKGLKQVLERTEATA